MFGKHNTFTCRCYQCSPRGTGSPCDFSHHSRPGDERGRLCAGCVVYVTGICDIHRCSPACSQSQPSPGGGGGGGPVPPDPAAQLTSLGAGEAVLGETQAGRAGTAGAPAARSAGRRRQTQVGALAVHRQTVVGAVRLTVRVVHTYHQRKVDLGETSQTLTACHAARTTSNHHSYVTNYHKSLMS